MSRFPPLTPADPPARPSAAMPRHFLSLDIARFLAACTVMLYHFGWHSWNAPETDYGIRAAIGTEVAYPLFGPLVRYGFLGVEVFFMISGFIIAVTAAGRTPGRFLRARIVRLAPALWTFALLAFGVTLIYSDGPLDTTLSLFWRSMVLYPTGPWLDGVLWTLTVEVVFYVVILLVLVFGMLRWLEWLTRGWVTLCTLAIAVAVAGNAGADLPEPLAALAGFVQSYGSRPLLVSTGPHFALGVLLYVALREGFGGLRFLFGGVALAGAAGSVWLTTGSQIGTAVWAAAILATGAALIREARRNGPPRNGRVTRAIRLLGLAAYPIYLIHNISGGWILGRLVVAGVPQTLALLLAVLACIWIACVFAARLEPRLQRLLRGLLESIGLGRGVPTIGGRQS